MSGREEFRRGWRIVLGGFLGIALGVSSLYFYSLGIFLKPLAAEFGWSRSQASLGPLLGTGCAALMAIPVGRLADRIGSARLAVGSLALLAGSFALLGWIATGLASFLALTAVLSLLTAGSSPLPFTRLVVGSFSTARGLALGIVLAGTGLGSILLPAWLPGFIADHGWRAGFHLLAGLITLLLPVVALLLRGGLETSATGTVPPFRDVLSHPAFARLALVFALASTAVLGTIVHFVPMLTDAGMSPRQAGGMTALIGLAAVAGRLATGWLLDRVRAEAVVTSLFLAAAAGMLLLAFGGPAAVPAGALVVGLCVGAEVDLIAYLVARDFARAAYGQAYGALYTVFLIGGAVGPALAGVIYDLTAGYRGWLGLAALLLAGAGTGMSGARRASRARSGT
ncbi:MFS transporter [Novosphingobium piscinae]|uniref:MFS transporter n=1 Tax=Novosphingobium piscinae TaxID=1507448 RepID=A0A7X1FWC6_9SPHN|nr:MFS transporter [Novosphingobium piscinae]MBC2667597.1 MFS transporter [Novosphingobium piscinae]